MAAGLVTAAYCLTVRRYGVELADEGALLAHMDRVAHGQVPYRDFHVGYGPALYWLHVPLLAWFGRSIVTVRTGLAAIHAVRAACLARLGTAVGGRAWGGALVVVLVGFFLPIAPGVCVPGNIPYPAWYADAVGLAAILLVGRKRAPAFTLGVLWGVVFAFKQNAGVLGLGAAAATLVLAADATVEPGATRGRGAGAIGPALAVTMLVGVALLLREQADALLVVVFVVPLLPLAVALWRSRGAAGGELVRLGAGFAVTAGAAIGIAVEQAGAHAVATDFLQLGTDTIRVYHTAHPTLGDVARQLDGAGVVRTARVVADAAWFAVFPLMNLTATCLVAGGRVRSRPALAIVAAAAIGYLQLFPRMDFWHLLPLAPASLASLAVVATALAPRTAGALAAVLAVVAIGRWAPSLLVIAAATRPSPSPPPVARVDVRWDLLDGEALRRFPEVVTAVGGYGRVAGFPALGLVNFALGRPSPWRHDYFFPGRPTADDERALVEATSKDPPDAVVVLDAPEGPFAGAAAAHPATVAMLERDFVEARRIGPYRILVPRRVP